MATEAELMPSASKDNEAEGNHPVAMCGAALEALIPQIASTFGIAAWTVVEVFVQVAAAGLTSPNACVINADTGERSPLTRAVAMAWLDDLRAKMTFAYDRALLDQAEAAKQEPKQ